MNNLADLYLDHGKYDKAEPLYVDCLNKKKKILGENNPHILTMNMRLKFLKDHGARAVSKI